MNGNQAGGGWRDRDWWRVKGGDRRRSWIHGRKQRLAEQRRTEGGKLWGSGSMVKRTVWGVVQEVLCHGRKLGVEAQRR